MAAVIVIVLVVKGEVRAAALVDRVWAAPMAAEVVAPVVAGAAARDLT